MESIIQQAPGKSNLSNGYARSLFSAKSGAILLWTLALYKPTLEEKMTVNNFFALNDEKSLLAIPFPTFEKQYPMHTYIYL